MKTKIYDLEDRLVNYASSIAQLCKTMPKDITGLYYGNQLLRSAGSSALNFGEAQGCQTNKDKIHKLSISFKELKETRVNLKILSKIGYSNSCILENSLMETEELIRIIATIIRNKRN